MFYGFKAKTNCWFERRGVEPSEGGRSETRRASTNPPTNADQEKMILAKSEARVHDLSRCLPATKEAIGSTTHPISKARGLGRPHSCENLLSNTGRAPILRREANSRNEILDHDRAERSYGKSPSDHNKPLIPKETRKRRGIMGTTESIWSQDHIVLSLKPCTPRRRRASDFTIIENPIHGVEGNLVLHRRSLLRSRSSKDIAQKRPALSNKSGSRPPSQTRSQSSSMLQGKKKETRSSHNCTGNRAKNYDWGQTDSESGFKLQLDRDRSKHYNASCHERISLVAGESSTQAKKNNGLSLADKCRCSPPLLRTQWPDIRSSQRRSKDSKAGHRSNSCCNIVENDIQVRRRRSVQCPPLKKMSSESTLKTSRSRRDLLECSGKDMQSPHLKKVSSEGTLRASRSSKESLECSENNLQYPQLKKVSSDTIMKTSRSQNDLLEGNGKKCQRLPLQKLFGSSERSLRPRRLSNNLLEDNRKNTGRSSLKKISSDRSLRASRSSRNLLECNGNGIPRPLLKNISSDRGLRTWSSSMDLLECTAQKETAQLSTTLASRSPQRADKVCKHQSKSLHDRRSLLQKMNSDGRLNAAQLTNKGRSGLGRCALPHKEASESTLKKLFSYRCVGREETTTEICPERTPTELETVTRDKKTSRPETELRQGVTDRPRASQSPYLEKIKPDRTLSEERGKKAVEHILQGLRAEARIQEKPPRPLEKACELSPIGEHRQVSPQGCIIDERQQKTDRGHSDPAHLQKNRFHRGPKQHRTTSLKVDAQPLALPVGNRTQHAERQIHRPRRDNGRKQDKPPRPLTVRSSLRTLEMVHPSLAQSKTEQEMYSLAVHLNGVIRLLHSVGINSIKERELTEAAIFLEKNGSTPVVFPSEMPGAKELNDDQINALVMKLQEANITTSRLMVALQDYITDREQQKTLSRLLAMLSSNNDNYMELKKLLLFLENQGKGDFAKLSDLPQLSGVPDSQIGTMLLKLKTSAIQAPRVIQAFEDYAGQRQQMNAIENLLESVGIDGINLELEQAAKALDGQRSATLIVFPTDQPGSKDLNVDQVESLLLKLQQAQAQTPKLIASLEQYVDNYC